jgi:hypothetical protein
VILWQANLGRGVSVAEFTRNLDRVLEAAGPRAVICFQEIDEADAPAEALILWARTRKTHYIIGRRTAVPILVPKHLRLFSALVTPACKGLAKFTPNRVVNEAVIQLRPDLAIGVLNTHLPLNRPQTFTRRRDVRKALRQRARAHEAGVWCADTNTRVGWPTIAPGERSVISAGIDKAKAWGPPDHRVRVEWTHTVPLTIDGHDAHGARLRWERDRA